jgi:chaperonin GroES
MDYTPNKDRVIVKIKLNDTKTENGIITTLNPEEEKIQQGTIVAVGPDVKVVEVGNTAIVNKFAGVPIKIEGEEYLSFREDDIEGVITENTLL